jgi:hypothetical protein
MKKYVIIMVTIFLGITSCEKVEEPVVEENQTENLWPPFQKIFSIKLGVYHGTRITAGNPFDCEGRSFCAKVEGTGEVTAGGVDPYDSEDPYNDEKYSFTLNNHGDYFEMVIGVDDISETVRGIVFEGDVFIMDHDYYFPDWVCDELATESCVLPEGSYPVIEGMEGNVRFNF